MKLQKYIYFPPGDLRCGFIYQYFAALFSFSLYGKFKGPVVCVLAIFAVNLRSGFHRIGGSWRGSRTGLDTTLGVFVLSDRLRVMGWPYPCCPCGEPATSRAVFSRSLRYLPRDLRRATRPSRGGGRWSLPGVPSSVLRRPSMAPARPHAAAGAVKRGTNKPPSYTPRPL